VSDESRTTIHTGKAPRTRGARPGAPEEIGTAYTSTPTAGGLTAGNPDGEPQKAVERGTGPTQAGAATRTSRWLRQTT
jgi:hypothetical protein